VQAIYLVTLLGFLVVGAYLVVRQVCVPLLSTFCLGSFVTMLTWLFRLLLVCSVVALANINRHAQAK
jgi:hypothetical protein